MDYVKRKSMNKAPTYLIEVFLPLFIILAQYSYGFLSFGSILMILVAAIYTIKAKSIYLYKPMLIFLIYMVFHDVIKVFFMNNIPSSYFNNLVSNIIFFLIISIVSSSIDEEKLYSVWKVMGVIVLIGIFYHSFLVFGLGQNVIPIRILPVPTGRKYIWNIGYARPRSFFSEPASFVLFIMPLLYMCLKKNKIVFGGIITIAIFLSTSTTGLMLSFVLWSYQIMRGQSRKNKIIAVTILVTLSFLLVTLPIFETTINKLQQTDIEGNFRLTRGYDIFFNSANEYKVFGVPYTTVGSYLLSGEVYVSNINPNIPYFDYVNTISQVLIIYGVIGVMLYIAIFYKLFRYGNQELRPFLLVMFLGMFGQSLFFNSFFIMQFIFLFGLSTNKDNKKLYIKLKK